MKLLDDGRWFHSFRQSWVNTWLTCPEQARHVLHGTYPVDESEAAAKGTAVHAGIERHLTTMAPLSDCLDVAVTTFREIAAGEHFRWVKVKTEATALKHIAGGLNSWWRFVRPSLGATIWCEHSFRFILCEDEARVIEIAGTVDYADVAGLSDWKLSGNADKYGRDSWKLKRWAVQPTFYVAAAYEAELFPHDGEVPFTFVALDQQGGRPQLAPANRTPQHIHWLKVQLRSIARQIERQVDEQPWPLNDQHPLCSADWCLVYDTCKGSHFPIDGDGTPVHFPLISLAA